MKPASTVVCASLKTVVDFHIKVWRAMEIGQNRQKYWNGHER
jgi:uncharacterized membrane protein